MNTKLKKIYRSIYENPVRADINWKDIELLLIALGATITEGNGSRIRILLNEQRAVFHRPHSESNTDKGAVKSMRKFLESAGIHYDDI